MAEWAKKLCVGLSFQINISIPLSAALSIYDDVTPPSVRLWWGGGALSPSRKALLTQVSNGSLKYDWPVCDWLLHEGFLDCHGDDFNNNWCRALVNILRPFWVSMFFSCAPVREQLDDKCGNKVYSRASGENGEIVISFYASKPSLTCFFFPPALDRNFYDTTRRILLGASFKRCGGGIWRRAQQTSSRL